MTPPERHAAVLEALDEQIETIRLAATGAGAAAHWLDTAGRLIRALEGCRRILQRHAPMVDEPRCDRCSYYRPTPWPCADWLDASAGVEVR